MQSVTKRTRLVKSRSKHMKGSKERLFIRTQTQNLQLFGVIPLSSYKTTLKRLKTMNNEMRSEITYLFGLSYVVFLQCCSVRSRVKV